MGRLDIVRELGHFLRVKRRWILAPILFFLLLFSVFIMLAEIEVLSPFIYALF